MKALHFIIVNPRRTIARLFLALAILCGLLVQPSEIGARPGPYHAGELLVATDEMKDPRFTQSIIYLVKHDADGALGLVINRPIAKGPIDDLLKGMGAQPKGSQLEIILHYGGPVSSHQGFLLHSDDVKLDSTMQIHEGIAVTADVHIIEAIAAGRGPRQFLFMLGYAGWAPGQLEAEIRAKSWFTIAADKSLIFDADAEKKWHLAVDRRQIPL